VPGLRFLRFWNSPSNLPAQVAGQFLDLRLKDSRELQNSRPGTDHSRLERAWLGNERLGYSLLVVDLDEEGQSDVEVINRSDLTYLGSADPQFEIRVSSIVVVDRAVTYWIATYACLAVALLGLALLVFGIARRRIQTRRLAGMKAEPAAD
jgi:hypothetical protein